MKASPNHPRIVGARRRERGFTMIEIALSLAVVAFALVAIIGVLPTGLQVQRDNREESIINADGAYILEAIRSGNDRLSLLSRTNQIAVYLVMINFHDGTRETIVNDTPDNPIDGQRLLGLLSTPRRSGGGGVSNVVAWVRALSGTAVDRDPAARDLSFRYQLVSEVVPHLAFPPAALATQSSNEIARLNHLQHNLHDIRLTFRWPLFRDNVQAPQNARVGTHRRTLRSLVGGTLTSYQTNILGRDLGVFYFAPSEYESAPKL